MKSSFYEISFGKVLWATSLILVQVEIVCRSRTRAQTCEPCLPCGFVRVFSALKLQCSLF